MFGYLETVPGTWDSTVGDGFNGSLSEESFLSTSPPIGGSLANESMLSTVANELRNAAAAGMTPTTTTAPSATTMPTITAGI